MVRAGLQFRCSGFRILSFRDQVQLFGIRSELQGQEFGLELGVSKPNA